jgi:hypothetical protein
LSLEIVTGVIGGSKTGLYGLFYIFVLVFYVYGKINWKWLLIGAIAVVFAVTGVATYRDYVRTYNVLYGESYTTRIGFLFNSLSEVVTSHPVGLINQTQDILEQRQSSIMEVTAAMMASHPEYYPFLGRELFSQILIQSIPRFLWPEKPSGRVDFYNIMSLYFDRPDTSFASPGQAGDAYRTGGWGMVIIWHLLLGGLGAVLYFWGPQRKNISNTVFYIIAIFQFIPYDEAIFISIQRGLIFGSILLIILNYVMHKRILKISE